MEAKMIRVLDLPVGASAEAAERALHDVCGEGFYLMAVYPLGTAGAFRAFYKRRSVKPVRDADGKEAEALAIIKANPDMPIRKLAELLRQRGIRRGKSWVSEHRAECVSD